MHYHAPRQTHQAIKTKNRTHRRAPSRLNLHHHAPSRANGHSNVIKFEIRTHRRAHHAPICTTMHRPPRGHTNVIKLEIQPTPRTLPICTTMHHPAPAATRTSSNLKFKPTAAHHRALNLHHHAPSCTKQPPKRVESGNRTHRPAAADRVGSRQAGPASPIALAPLGPSIPVSSAPVKTLKTDRWTPFAPQFLSSTIKVLAKTDCPKYDSPRKVCEINHYPVYPFRRSQHMAIQFRRRCIAVVVTAIVALLGPAVSTAHAGEADLILPKLSAPIFTASAGRPCSPGACSSALEG